MATFHRYLLGLTGIMLCLIGIAYCIYAGASRPVLISPAPLLLCSSFPLGVRRSF